MLQASLLSVGYDGLPIVREASMQVRTGEIVGIVGPNGCGKSTVLRGIVGLAERLGGSVYFQGQEVSRLQVHELTRMGLGYVPQTNNIFPSLTVEENLRVGGESLAPRLLAEQLAKVSEIFPEITARLKLPAQSLSGGMRQSLAIARALMGRPRCLIMDEPSAGLSGIVIERLFKRIVELSAEGLGFLIAEQNIRDLLKICDRLYVMGGGEVRSEIVNVRDGGVGVGLEDILRMFA
jgi:branched-chain amino acid transport system ATP-binding protein